MKLIAILIVYYWFAPAKAIYVNKTQPLRTDTVNDWYYDYSRNRGWTRPQTGCPRKPYKSVHVADRNYCKDACVEDSAAGLPCVAAMWRHDGASKGLCHLFVSEWHNPSRNCMTKGDGAYSTFSKPCKWFDRPIDNHDWVTSYWIPAHYETKLVDWNIGNLGCFIKKHVHNDRVQSSFNNAGIDLCIDKGWTLSPSPQVLVQYFRESFVPTPFCLYYVGARTGDRDFTSPCTNEDIQTKHGARYYEIWQDHCTKGVYYSLSGLPLGIPAYPPFDRFKQLGWTFENRGLHAILAEAQAKQTKQ